MMQQTCISCNVKNSGMIAIYQHPNGLDDMFRAITDVEVQAEDHLCVLCYDDMKLAYRFRQRCRQNMTLRLTNQTERTQSLAASEQSVNSSTDVSTTVNDPISFKEESAKEHTNRENTLLENNPPVLQLEVVEELALDNETLPDDAEISIEIVELEQEAKNVVQEQNKCDSDDPNENVKDKGNNTTKHLSDDEHVTPSDNMSSTTLDKVDPKKEFLPRLPKVHSLMCEYCFKEFELLAEKIEHTEGHLSEPKPFKCVQDGCGGAFKDRVGLRAHVRIHATVKRYGCRYCSMRFHTLGNRNAHERTHNGEKPFICPKCGKGFAEGGNLKNHIRFHDGERPYTCGMCGKSYRTHYSRSVHMRSHTNDRPFVCDDCGKGFYSSGKLTIHRRTHTGERPYECGTCSAKFADTCGLRRHMIKRH
ncbi:zinc finger protein 37-like [Anopheles maculipalpis]|uniref:zinc finger protein 37-like n=1 Tax=Anopheles maculipalpis TaxID=1496333 RepID=UPI002158B11D|nr:zinc finger protein 37-like [Anopheles maculipalpis]